MNPERNDIEESEHKALDSAIDGLRKALHLQLGVMQRTINSPDIFEHAHEIDQSSYLVAKMLEQIRMVIVSPRIDAWIRERQKIRALEVQEVISRFDLDKLKPLLDTDKPE
jgi:hypothetical protein